MKRIVAVMSVLSLVLWFTACGGSGGEAAASKKIKGQAAIGAFLAQGSQVEIRPLPVSGEPCDIITTTVMDDAGAYEAPIETVTQEGLEVPTEPTEVSGYVIRAMSVSGWLYSYAANTDNSTIANITPYSDMMVKKFYQGKSEDITVNFSTGFRTDGITPISSPDGSTIDQVAAAMSRMLARVYNMPSIEDFMTSTWVEGTGLDGLLNNALTGPHLNWFLNQGFTNLFASPDAIYDGAAIQDELGDPVVVDIWTTHGETGSVTLGAITDLQGTVSPAVTMTKAADSTTGHNHFHAQTAGLMQVSGQNVSISISDYNGGTAFQVVIQTP